MCTASCRTSEEGSNLLSACRRQSEEVILMSRASLHMQDMQISRSAAHPATLVMTELHYRLLLLMRDLCFSSPVKVLSKKPKTPLLYSTKSSESNCRSLGCCYAGIRQWFSSIQKQVPFLNVISMGFCTQNISTKIFFPQFSSLNYGGRSGAFHKAAVQMPVFQLLFFLKHGCLSISAFTRAIMVIRSLAFFCVLSFFLFCFSQHDIIVAYSSYMAVLSLIQETI